MCVLGYKDKLSLNNADVQKDGNKNSQLYTKSRYSKEPVNSLNKILDFPTYSLQIYISELKAKKLTVTDTRTK